LTEIEEIWKLYLLQAVLGGYSACGLPGSDWWVSTQSVQSYRLPQGTSRLFPPDKVALSIHPLYRIRDEFMTPPGNSRWWTFKQRFAFGTLIYFSMLGFASAGYTEGDHVSELITALTSADRVVRANAASALGEIKDSRAIEPLVAAILDGSDQLVSQNAAEALAKLDSARAVELLVSALKDPNERGVAADALAVIGSRAVEPLIPKLMDPNRYVRQDVARTLALIRDPRAVDSLIATLKDSDEDVRLEAAWGLGVVMHEPRAIVPLIAALKEPKPDAQHDIANAIARVGTSAVESVITALNDSNSKVRGGAADALGMIVSEFDANNHEPRAVNALLNALRERNMDVIAGAHVFFMARGEPGSENVLIEALNKSGGLLMAEAFLNCGNPKLENGGREWAQRHGYQIKSGPANAVRWGGSR
jgi:HEAT repeat protein